MNGSLAGGATLLLIGTLTACSFAPVYKTPDSVPAASAYRGVRRLESGATPGQPEPRCLVDAISRSAAGRARSEGGRRQPGFEGGVRAAAAGPCRHANRAGRSIPDAERRRLGDSLQNLGQFAHLCAGQESDLQQLRPGSRSVLRIRCLGPGAQRRDVGKGEPASERRGPCRPGSVDSRRVGDRLFHTACRGRTASAPRQDRGGLCPVAAADAESLSTAAARRSPTSRRRRRSSRPRAPRPPISGCNARRANTPSRYCSAKTHRHSTWSRIRCRWN